MDGSQRRWFCRECKREWIDPIACFANSAPVTITGNPKSMMNCPTCGSPEIELVEFKPDLPGLDIPRDRSNKIVPIEQISEIRGLDLKIEGRPLENRNPEELIVPPVFVEKESNPIYDLSDMD